MGRVGRFDAGQVGDRYRLIEQLGAGGMSVVWLGRDEVLGRQVAIKVLAPQLADDDSFRRRIRVEALAAAQLCHPHITAVYDYGEAVLPDGATVPYVVMELIDGESLADRLARVGSLPWQTAVTACAQVAAALATAHARGVVHRDVTPGNVMLTNAGAKVVDFGISALVGERDAAPDGSLLGTPAYLSPERLNGRPVSPATDVYALGLLLYRTLTGHLPWPVDSTADVLKAHLYAEPEPLPKLDGLPDPVARLCLGCLAKQPEDRPPGTEVARALAEAAGIPAIIPAWSGPANAAAAMLPPFDTTDNQPASGKRPEPRPDAGPRGRRPTGAAPSDRRPGHLAAVGRRGPAVAAPMTRSRAAAQAPGPFGLGPRRLQALAATITLAVAGGLGWFAGNRPTDIGSAQAAGPGTGMGAADSGCRVSYRLRSDTGTSFDAAVSVANTGPRTLTGWRLQFQLPGDQRVAVQPPYSAVQRGRLVVVRAAEAGLPPGDAALIRLRGAYRAGNPAPAEFALDGRACQVQTAQGSGTTLADGDGGAGAEPAAGTGGAAVGTGTGTAGADPAGAGAAGAGSSPAGSGSGPSGSGPSGSGSSGSGSTGSGSSGSGSGSSGGAGVTDPVEEKVKEKEDKAKEKAKEKEDKAKEKAKKKKKEKVKEKIKEKVKPKPSFGVTVSQLFV